MDHMMRRKKIYLLLIASIIVVTISAIRYRPRTLGEIMPKEIWEDTQTYQIAEFDTFNVHEFKTDEIRLNLGEYFKGVKVRGPFKEKNTATGYTWIDLRTRLDGSEEARADKKLSINIIREEINAHPVYSFNINNQCYSVISGQDEIDEFIEKMYDFSEQKR